MVCSGQQVTDTVCTFSCNVGYDLTGSTSRTCLPDHTWSGEETSCPPLECDELTATYGPDDLQIVIAPCNNEVYSECSVFCAEGYHIDSSDTWTQTCSLTDEGDSVQWSDEPVCIGKYHTLCFESL